MVSLRSKCNYVLKFASSIAFFHGSPGKSLDLADPRGPVGLLSPQLHSTNLSFRTSVSTPPLVHLSFFFFLSSPFLLHGKLSMAAEKP